MALIARPVRFSLLAVAALPLLLTGCFTGQRPSFGCSGGETTGRAEIDAVLTRFDCVAPARFTADYSILTRLGGIESAAVVVQDVGRRSVTINDVRYLNNEGQEATCDLVAGTCEAVINEARTSDLQVTSEFYATAMANRLRVDAERRIGDPVASELQIAGQTAACVDLPVTGGIKVYCALETGVLAKYDGNDLLIELTGYSPTPDELAFET